MSLQQLDRLVTSSPRRAASSDSSPCSTDSVTEPPRPTARHGPGVRGAQERDCAQSLRVHACEGVCASRCHCAAAGVAPRKPETDGAPPGSSHVAASRLGRARGGRRVRGLPRRAGAAPRAGTRRGSDGGAARARRGVAVPRRGHRERRPTRPHARTRARGKRVSWGGARHGGVRAGVGRGARRAGRGRRRGRARVRGVPQAARRAARRGGGEERVGGRHLAFEIRALLRASASPWSARRTTDPRNSTASTCTTSRWSARCRAWTCPRTRRCT